MEMLEFWALDGGCGGAAHHIWILGGGVPTPPRLFLRFEGGGSRPRRDLLEVVWGSWPQGEI
eukprot:291647-Prorocentrum_minimum.AAC.1